MNPATILVLISVAAVGVGLTVAAVASRKPLLTASDRLFLIGDSLGVGLLPHLVEAMNGVGVATAGAAVGGTNIRQWAGKPVVTLAKEFNATAVLIVLGSNDAAASEKYVTEDAPHYAHVLVRSLTDAGLKVIWLAPGDTGALKYSKEIRTMLRALAVGEAITEYEVPSSVEYSPFDYIHLTPKGYGQLAQWLVEQTTRT